MKMQRARGFSIIEFMIAATLSLVVLAALSAAFVGSSRSRAELERANQQIENGRYAVQTLNDDLQHAGYFAQLDTYCFTCTGNNLFASGYTALNIPDPCTITLANLRTDFIFHVQGYNGGATLTCLNGSTGVADVKAGTDIVVIRRASTCVGGTTNCGMLAGAPYFQASTADICGGVQEVSSETATDRFKIDTNTAALTLHSRGCTATADKQRYLVHIYWVANNNQPGDGIPTLKRAELDLGASTTCQVRSQDGNFCFTPIAEGIENLQVEYGIDHTGSDGAPDAYSADPSRYTTAGGTATGTNSPVSCADNGAPCVANWLNVTAMRVYVLARGTTPSRDYVDTKTYSLGGTTVAPSGDSYKRHVYDSSIWLANPAGRRQT